jgi:hypothetical protein
MGSDSEIISLQPQSGADRGNIRDSRTCGHNDFWDQASASKRARNGLQRTMCGTVLPLPLVLAAYGRGRQQTFSMTALLSGS